jgi:hypothetical protein
MRLVRQVAVFIFSSLALGLVFAEGVVIYALLIGQSECTGETWLNRTKCGDSGWVMFGVCVVIAAVMIACGIYLVRRLRRPMSR